MEQIKNPNIKLQNNLNETSSREKQLEEMMRNGELGCMTEVAYGSVIADRENPNKDKQEKDNGHA